MTNIHTYCVAGWYFDVHLPAGADVCTLLPSFSPFRITSPSAEPRLFCFHAHQPFSVNDSDAPILEESENDLGHVVIQHYADGYLVRLHHGDCSSEHLLRADAAFSCIHASLLWDDPYIGHALSSLLRIAFSQAILLHQGIALHAAAVVRQDRVYLFMGRSGTGKSTHAAGWLRCFCDSFLLNDDNPILRLHGQELWAYGSPWSGKTPCYVNQGFPVAAMVRLFQAPYNRFRRLSDIEAFTAILPGCFAVHADERLYDTMCDTLASISCLAIVGSLHCLPNDDAVYTLEKSIADCLL